MKTESGYQGKEVLDIMSKYAVNRNNAIEECIKRYFLLYETKEPKKILEFGAGSGEFINRFKKYSNLTTFAVEIDDAYFQTLSRDHRTYRHLDELHEEMDFIFAIDVLEHIQDDEGILKAFFVKLGPNGQLLVYVPARPELYSKFDAAIGHCRRYRFTELQQKVRDSGFTIRVARYDDFLGYFAAVFNKLTSDGSLNARAVKVYDKFLVPLTRAMESVIRPPIGKNILLVAQKVA